MTRSTNTPVAYLTLGELLAEIEEATETVVKRVLAGTPSGKQESSHVYGLKGLANLLECSKTQASRINTSGLLDETKTQIGALLIFNADKVLELARRADQERKQGKRRNK